jgi:hypothetical protein
VGQGRVAGVRQPHVRTPGGGYATVLGGYVPRQASGWMWDLTAPGNDDHDFYIDTGAAPVLVHNCDDPSQMDRTGSGLKDDVFHRAVSWVVNNPLAQRFSITGGDGMARDLYQLSGEINGKQGVFEWIVDNSGDDPVIRTSGLSPEEA